LGASDEALTIATTVAREQGPPDRADRSWTPAGGSVSAGWWTAGT